MIVWRIPPFSPVPVSRPYGSPYGFYQNRTACNLPWNGAAQFTHNLYRQPKGHGNQLSAWFGSHNATEDVRLGIPERIHANAEAITVATVTSDRHRPIYHGAAGPRINRILINPPPVNERATEMYVCSFWLKNCTATSDSGDVVPLAQLRSGHTPLLKTHANLINSSTYPQTSLQGRAAGCGTPATDMRHARCYKTKYLGAPIHTSRP